MGTDGRDETTLGPLGTALLALLGGLAVIGLALVLAREAEPSGGGWATVAGVVVAVNGADGSCTAVVRYEVGGHAYTVDADADNAESCTLRGASVDVAYLPERPGGGRPRVRSGQGPVTGVVVGGLVLIALGLVGLARLGLATNRNGPHLAPTAGA
jgi:hypothetical protein